MDTDNTVVKAWDLGVEVKAGRRARRDQLGDGGNGTNVILSTIKIQFKKGGEHSHQMAILCWLLSLFYLAI